ncbi:MAG: hypothetical protein PHR35_11595 [Kiritimatiellae bacterium]|nr:hypothetical protein [Kiritimatiellia bacterium]
MNTPKDRLQQQNRAVGGGMPQAVADLDIQAEGLVDRAIAVLAEQTATVEVSPLESQYKAALDVQVEAKHEQVERIEDKLEDLIERQASRLQTVQGQQPGLLALPGVRARWQQQLVLEQSTMQRLHGRLETVREIAEGMGEHGPRIEELAARKLRAHEPGLASEWDEMMEARRQHEALLRQRGKVEYAREHGLPVAHGLRLGQMPSR